MYQGNLMSLDRKVVNTFTFLKQPYLFVRSEQEKVEGEVFDEYLCTLTDGEVSLYLWYDLKIVKANYNPDLQAGSKKDKLVPIKVYYLKKKDGNSLMPVRKKKDVIAFYKEMGKNVIYYDPSENLKFLEKYDVFNHNINIFNNDELQKWVSQ